MLRAGKVSFGSFAELRNKRLLNVVYTSRLSMMKNGRIPLFIHGMIIVAVSLSRYGNFVSVKEKSLFAYLV